MAPSSHSSHGSLRKRVSFSSTEPQVIASSSAGATPPSSGTVTPVAPRTPPTVTNSPSSADPALVAAHDRSARLAAQIGQAWTAYESGGWEIVHAAEEDWENAMRRSLAVTAQEPQKAAAEEEGQVEKAAQEPVGEGPLDVAAIRAKVLSSLQQERGDGLAAVQQQQYREASVAAARVGQELRGDEHELRQLNKLDVEREQRVMADVKQAYLEDKQAEQEIEAAEGTPLARPARAPASLLSAVPPRLAGEGAEYDSSSATPIAGGSSGALSPFSALSSGPLASTSGPPQHMHERHRDSHGAPSQAATLAAKLHALEPGQRRPRAEGLDTPFNAPQSLADQHEHLPQAESQRVYASTEHMSPLSRSAMESGEPHRKPSWEVANELELAGSTMSFSCDPTHLEGKVRYQAQVEAAGGVRPLISAPHRLDIEEVTTPGPSGEVDLTGSSRSRLAPEVIEREHERKEAQVKTRETAKVEQHSADPQTPQQVEHEQQAEESLSGPHPRPSVSRGASEPLSSPTPRRPTFARTRKLSDEETAVLIRRHSHPSDAGLWETYSPPPRPPLLQPSMSPETGLPSPYARGGAPSTASAPPATPAATSAGTSAPALSASGFFAPAFRQQSRSPRSREQDEPRAGEASAPEAAAPRSEPLAAGGLVAGVPASPEVGTSASARMTGGEPEEGAGREHVQERQAEEHGEKEQSTKQSGRGGGKKKKRSGKKK